MKTLTIALLLSATTLLTHAQSSCDNPILTNLQINETTVTEPIQVEDLDYCQDLEDSSSCCSEATINGFQAAFDTRKNEIEAKMADQDENFERLIREDYADFRRNVTEFNRQLERIEEFDDNVYNQLIRTLDPVIQSINSLSQAIDESIDNFGDFQSNRKNCMESLLDLQASATCLACDASAESQGVSQNGNINLSDDTCQRITDDCRDYLESAARISIIGAMSGVNRQITEVTAFLVTINRQAEPLNNTQPVIIPNITNITEPAQNDTEPLVEEAEDDGNVEGVDVQGSGQLVLNGTNVTNTTNTTQNQEINALLEEIRAFQIPRLQIGQNANITRLECNTDDDDNTGCQWLCTRIFNNGQVNYDALLLGGTPRQQLNNDQLITISDIISGENDDDDNNGLFEDGETLGAEAGEDAFIAPSGVTWNPDDGNSNIDTGLEENPADVDLGEAQDDVNDQTGGDSQTGVGVPGSGSRLAISLFAMVAGLFIVF